MPCPLPTPLCTNGACEQGGANGVRCLLVATPLPCACPLPLVHATSRGCAPPLFGAPPLSLVRPPSRCPLTPPFPRVHRTGGTRAPLVSAHRPPPSFHARRSRPPPLSANGAWELGARTGVVRKRRSQARPPPPLPRVPALCARPRLAPPPPPPCAPPPSPAS